MSPAAAQLTRLKWGAICTLLGAGVAAAVWGRRGGEAAAAVGGAATMVQLLAARLMARTGRPASLDQLKVYAIGVVLRFVAVAALWVVVTVDGRAFPVLPSALGFLGTMLPLLYLETRLAQ